MDLIIKEHISNMPDIFIPSNDSSDVAMTEDKQSDEDEDYESEGLQDKMGEIYCDEETNSSNRINSIDGNEDTSEDGSQCYHGGFDCGHCKYKTITEVHIVTLRRDYGNDLSQMNCWGSKCGKNIVDLMKKNEVVSVCENCLEKTCRRILCSSCYSENMGTRNKARRFNGLEKVCV